MNYQYDTIRAFTASNLTNVLNAWGDQGWELVSVVKSDPSDTGATDYIAFVKRLKLK